MENTMCGARADFQTAGLNGVFAHFCRRGQKWVAPERETSPCRLRPKVTRARRRGTASAPPKQKWVAPQRETAPYSKKETDADASVSFCISQYASFSARYAFSSPMGTRTLRPAQLRCAGTPIKSMLGRSESAPT